MFEEFEDKNYKSRSQKKRDSTAAQELGVRLANLALADLRKLNIPEDMLEAVADWKNFSGHEAKRRQMQYIGKLMREMDIDALQERLSAFLAPNRADTASLHAIETLRDTLVAAEGKDLEMRLSELTEQYPSLKTSHIRHLAETASSERLNNKPPKAYRELFKTLKRAMDTP